MKICWRFAISIALCLVLDASAWPAAAQNRDQKAPSSCQCYAVIAAIAERDAPWARKLSDRMLEEEAREAEEKATRDMERDARTAQKLLSAASSLLFSDQAAAVRFARNSLRFPATM